MATRSYIGMTQEDGTILGIYCHFDGYLDGVGATLAAHYTDPAHVQALMALGDLSQLGAIPATCQAYCRDIGGPADETRAVVSPEMGDFLSNAAEWSNGYAYLFTPRGWLYFRRRFYQEDKSVVWAAAVPLAEAVQQQAA